ncbi:hypothetical protein ST201phi2-1p038 [Pseudomonas phage 201phi2-1]|uniref:Uncharacterized protein n=1 Tax=Pseudomonas phage 201phi2-1 TaxID=198110 RepID=B3FK13_BP201|nr:hypothetical protein ST201phi2-1p038 [Pseudomonas phage 201phi2-1]ABY62871.1 hypothetical protein 201phi2-1p038 [Pseudomonas phage 201phi2-1]
MEHQITGDDRIYLNTELVNPPMSNGERKKIMAREHNRAYGAGEPTRQIETLEQSVRSMVQGFQEALGVRPKAKKEKRWGKKK